MLNAETPSAPASVFDSIDFSASRAVLAAVSGGSDSTALLLLLAEYLGLKHPGCRLVAVTVDHALRPESAGEARQVAVLCAGIGVEHIVTRWADQKPATGLAAAAREARYRLLVQAAIEAGASMIFTGHTADDQAETVLMRAARSEGRGLAGMAPATLLDGKVWLMRPLLGERRETLRDWLRARNAAWIDDPSNDNPASERVRTRRTLTGPGDIEQLVAKASQAAAARVDLGIRATSIIETRASRPALGLIRLDPAFLGAEVSESAYPLRGGGRGGSSDREAAIYALRLLLAAVGGRGELPDEAATGTLVDRLSAGPLRTTLSRAVIDARADGIWLYRESRGLPAARAAAAGDLWDGRYRLMGAPSDGATIAPAGADWPPAELPSDAPPALVRAALAAEPALWRDGVRQRLLAVPGTPALQSIPIVAPWAHFLPSFDLAPARAIASLIGVDLPPSPPYRGHTRRGA